MFMIGARKHHKGWWASDVVLATLQNQQAPSVSLCTEESVTVHCAKTVLRPRVVESLIKEGPKACCAKATFRDFPNWSSQMLLLQSVSKQRKQHRLKQSLSTLVSYCWSCFPLLPNQRECRQGATGEVLSTFLTTSGPCYKDHLITR